ncbi:hypothetical protein [Levilactobacillus bambusae]|uniref:Uncharacterized protein n=1 Tax=Levilactobacillus bambusae TaxID=2024736 RepID=A0A2V1N1D9_9LACO|nr:hypothetical protein [Levilactobacillus bambusae]PWG00130.1 hypothetical protein DCM90_04125 [Levilactobacillus bambusae]
MNQRENWLLEQISGLEKQATDFKTRAYFHQLKDLVDEQYRRIEQTEDEIDGRAWNPSEW